MAGFARLIFAQPASTLLLVLLLAALSACASDNKEIAASAQAAANECQLGPDDKVQVTVLDEPEVSGEFQVDKAGVLAAPFVGQMLVRGMTLRAFETAYAEKLRTEKILREPR